MKWGEGECVPTPVSSGGEGLFIHELLNDRVLEKISNEAFQALWVEITFENKKNVICGILYRKHNSPECFHLYLDESIENFTYCRKDIVIMGDFNIDLVKCESSNYSHNFLSSLQNCYLTPAIVKPTRVSSTSATPIDNIFINNPDKVVACGNLISDISDHISQFCILKSMKGKIRVKRSKMRDFSRFSSDRLHADLSNVNWNALFSNESSDANNVFSSFYNKFNKLVNKHAPMKTNP